MYSRFRSTSRRARVAAISLRGLVALLAIVSLVLQASCERSEARQTSSVLRVCADPNNLPFSNRARQGFENRIADVIARDMGASVEYTWWAQRRGFIRNTLNAESC